VRAVPEQESVTGRGAVTAERAFDAQLQVDARLGIELAPRAGRPDEQGEAGQRRERAAPAPPAADPGRSLPAATR